MPDLTATQRLPRPVAGDLTKEQAERQAALATEFNDRIRLHRAAVDLSRRPPAAVLRLTSSVTMNLGSGDPERNWVPFDLVELDTANMTDLAVSAKKIFVSRLGYYQVGGYVNILGTGCSPGQLDLRIDGTGGFTGFEIANSVRETGQGFAAVSVSGMCRRNSSSSASSFLNLEVGTTGTCTTSIVTATVAKFWAFWVADL